MSLVFHWFLPTNGDGRRLVEPESPAPGVAAGARPASERGSVGVIATKLFDSRTGSFVEVPAGRIQQVLSAPQDGALFEGSGSLVFNQ